MAIIYVKNLEDAYTYGVVTGFERDKENDVTGYRIFADGIVSTYSAANIGKINTSVGAGVGFLTQNGVLKKITSLVMADSAKDIDAVEGGRIMLDGEIYQMSPEVFIADVTSKLNVRCITVDELAKLENIKEVILYADKALMNGGQIRVISIKTEE